MIGSLYLHTYRGGHGRIYLFDPLKNPPIPAGGHKTLHPAAESRSIVYHTWRRKVICLMASTVLGFEEPRLMSDPVVLWVCVGVSQIVCADVCAYLIYWCRGPAYAFVHPSNPYTHTHTHTHLPAGEAIDSMSEPVGEERASSSLRPPPPPWWWPAPAFPPSRMNFCEICCS